MPRARKYNLAALYFPEKLLDRLELLAQYPVAFVEAPSGLKDHGGRKFFEEPPRPAKVFWLTACKIRSGGCIRRCAGWCGSSIPGPERGFRRWVFPPWTSLWR